MPVLKDIKRCLENVSFSRSPFGYKVSEVDSFLDDLQKKMRFILITGIIMIVFECIYFKNIQNGIIDFLKNMESGIN